MRGLSAPPAIPGQGVRSPNSRTVGSLDLSLPIAPTADPGAITGEALSNHRLAYVFPVQVADPHTTILRALAVEFAP